MTPKKLIEKLREEAVTELGKARLEGALAMHDLYLNRQRRYYSAHREHHNEYQREYQRKRRLTQANK